jgi:peptide/nickel transport system ATP-binding protein
VMYAGRIVESGPVEAIFADPQHPYTIGLMSSMPALGRRSERLATIPGSVPPPSELPEGCRFTTRCPFAIARCHVEVPPFVADANGHGWACHRAPLEDLADEVQ